LAIAALAFAFFVPWAITEAVWWLSRRGTARSRSQQLADLGRYVIPNPLLWLSPPWIAALLGAGLALLAAVMLFSTRR